MTNKNPELNTELFKTYEKKFAQGNQIFEQGLARIFIRAIEKINVPADKRKDYFGGDGLFKNDTVRSARAVATLLQDRDRLQEALGDIPDFAEINKDASVKIVNPPPKEEQLEIIRRAVHILDSAVQFHGLRAVFQQKVNELNTPHEAEFLAQNPKQKISDVVVGQWDQRPHQGGLEWHKTGVEAVHPVTLEIEEGPDKQVFETHLGSVDYAQILTGLATLKRSGDKKPRWIPELG